MWLENVGEITLDEGDNIFWMLPHIFGSPFKSFVASPYFSFEKENWRLAIIPSNGQRPNLSSGSYIGLFLWRKGCEELKNKYAVWLSIQVSDVEDICCHNGELDSDYGFGKWDIVEISRFSKKCIRSGRIRITCRIRRIEDASDTLLCLTSETEEDKNEVECTNEKDLEKESELKGVDRLTQNFGDLLHNAWGSDVVLKTKDHDFHVHRIIIGARSPVFSSMLKLDMTVKNSNEIDISDCSSAAFKVFLQYLYTAKADTISSDNVSDLYYIADKYQVEDLKSDCVLYMKNALSVDNICDVLTLCVNHNESDLENCATHFFRRNINQILHTLKWQVFITENPMEANKLYIKGIRA